jgi:hypothetical protein
MTITLEDANELLKVAQRYDNRTIAEGNIEGWYAALRDLDYPECVAAIIRHHQDSTDFVAPAHIRRVVADLRSLSRKIVATQDEDNHCGRPSCVCDHKHCDHGWIGSDNGGVLHCVTCHPGRRQEPNETRMQWFARLQMQNADWAKKQRNAN